MMTRLFTSLILGSSLLAGGLGTYALAQNAPMQAAPQTAYAPFSDPANVPADLARVDAALNSTGSFQGDFRQISSDGSIASGKIWLQRPGKMRFEFQAPSPLLIVSDGVTMTQRDSQLETEDRVPLSATPLNYFLKENVNLANDTEVVGLIKRPDVWLVSARDGSGENEGTLTLVMDANTLALQQWIISDDFGGQTRVELSNLQYNARVDPRLFVLRDNSRDRRRN